MSWGSGSGTRQIDSFATRTYSKTHSTQTVSLTISWDASFGSYYNYSFHKLGSGSHTWTLTVPKLASYTVSYNANGGSGAPSSQTKWYGETLTLSSTKPTRTGYTFQGWGTSASDTSVNYAAGASYTSNAAITLYAIWKAKTYTVSYNANGGTDAPASQTKTHGVAMTITTSEPVREGYSFLGWSTSSTATTATWSAGGSYTTNASDTLYAVWVQNTFIVSYNANGGTGAPASQTKNGGVTLVLSKTKPTRTGYTFAGWGTSSTATTVSYAAGANYTTDASIKLYAIWTAHVCTITYNLNGGSGSISDQTHTCGTATTLTTTKPTKDDYSFLGWSTSSSATKAAYLAGRSYTNTNHADGDIITLYAVWVKVRNIFVKVPDGSSLSAIHVRIPDGSSIKNIYYRVDDTYLITSDGLTLVDSNGNYLIAKDG